MKARADSDRFMNIGARREFEKFALYIYFCLSSVCAFFGLFTERFPNPNGAEPIKFISRANAESRRSHFSGSSPVHSPKMGEDNKEWR